MKDLIWNNFMRTTINLSGLLEELDNDFDAVPYVLKLHLKEVHGIPLIIDPLNPGDPTFEVSEGEFKHEYLVDGTSFSVTVEYSEKVG
ncbi:hypothetical protein MYO4S_00030 [Serratia phage 4S]|nr:hypothetical protein MYO4S_00030 [Serratia phage 4S]